MVLRKPRLRQAANTLPATFMRHYQTILILLTLTTQFAFGQMKPNWQFRSELMAQFISPKDTIYIQDRHHLEKLTVLQSTDTTATLNYTTKTGDKISIYIHCGKFEPTKHKLHLYDTIYKFIHNENRVDYLVSKDLIDGKRAYGIDGGLPRTEIKELKIKWNGKWLVIPDSSFANFYEIHTKTIEAYISEDKKFIYLYISASDGAGSYSVKFVFNKNGFVTRLISTNECTDGFDFIDALPKECE